MTTTNRAPQTASASPRAVDLVRVCVAARSVLDDMPELVAAGLAGSAAASMTGHARALSDLPSVRGLPLATLRAHAVAVHDGLTRLACDRSLTLAAWIDDGLGSA
jgi:hypothetical protein